MASIAAMAARLRALGPKVVEAALPDVAEALRNELGLSINSAQSADGVVWAVRKAGGPALVNAITAVGVGVVDRMVVIRITGPEARHHRGRVKGGLARPILPTGGLPGSWTRAIKKILDRHFAEAANNG
jgi:hypothetical protein